MLGYPTPSPSRFPDKDSVSYLREKNRQFKLLVDAQRDSDATPINRKILQVTWCDLQRKATTRKLKITNSHGSMLMSDVWQRQQEIIEQEEASVTKKVAYQDELRTLYDKCKGGCTCESANCKAKGLYLCMTCEPSAGVMKKQICQVKKCIEARGKPNAIYQPPLPAKSGARSKPNSVGHKRRSRDEDEEEEEEGDGEFVPEENGRVSDMDISSAGSDSEDDAFDSQHESEESDEDPHDDDLLFAAVEKSVHRKGYPWTLGAHYRVFWPTLGKWLVGQYDGPALRTGVTLWYECDDSVATHLYKDKWHITPYRATGPEEAG